MTLIDNQVNTRRSIALQFSAWLLVTAVSLLAIVAWGKSFSWHLSSVSAYQFFPLLGLLAFSIMWSHYIIGLIRQGLAPKASLAKYYQYTGYLVLLLILLHPGIFVFERFKDGYGLPPGSYKTFVAPGMAWVVSLGTISLLAFLAFELKRFFADRTWWKYVLFAGDAAMVAIFYHGLKLGDQLQAGWYRTVWLTYGFSLIAVLLISYTLRINEWITQRSATT